MLATSSGDAMRPMIEVARFWRTKSRPNASSDCPAFSAPSFIIAATPGVMVGPGSTALTVTAVPRAILARAARDREQGRFGEAVMDHVVGDVDARFRGHEHDPTPATLQHAGHQGPRQADRRHHVGLEEALPFLVVDLEERPAAIDPGIVDQDIDRGDLPDQGLAPRRGREIGRHALDRRARHRGPKLAERPLDGLGLAAVDHDLRARRREACPPRHSRCRLSSR